MAIEDIISDLAGNQTLSRSAIAGMNVEEIRLPLVVGVSSRALFDLAEDHGVFINNGPDAYDALQRNREEQMPASGASFDIVRRLASLNRASGRDLVRSC